MNKIIGAGLSGLICGALNAQAQVFERNGSDFVGHRAVLRFREDKIARALGLAFRKVSVRKALWMEGREAAPSPRLANMYSEKVRGMVGESSIWNLAPSERFIAPDDLHAILATICGSRVSWNYHVELEEINEWRSGQYPATIISTIPITQLLTLLGESSPILFPYSPIFVQRFHVRSCDVFQTIYFPDREMPVYRATLTGELLTIEYSGLPGWGDGVADKEVLDAFGLRSEWLADHRESHRQSFGKIAPVASGPRKALLHHLTTRWGIYSLGRFATWRNILLDDVYDDIAAIRRMMSQSQYDVSLERMKT
jgi:hypothetical protein